MPPWITPLLARLPRRVGEALAHRAGLDQLRAHPLVRLGDRRRAAVAAWGAPARVQQDGGITSYRFLRWPLEIEACILDFEIEALYFWLPREPDPAEVAWLLDAHGDGMAWTQPHLGGSRLRADGDHLLSVRPDGLISLTTRRFRDAMRWRTPQPSVA